MKFAVTAVKYESVVIVVKPSCSYHIESLGILKDRYIARNIKSVCPVSDLFFDLFSFPSEPIRNMSKLRRDINALKPSQSIEFIRSSAPMACQVNSLTFSHTFLQAVRAFI